MAPAFLAPIGVTAAPKRKSHLARATPQRHAHPSRTALRRVRPMPTMDLPGEGIYAPNVKPSDVRVVVFGATGYIGRYVVRQFCAEGYNVVAFARRRAGVGGKLGAEEVEKDLAPAHVVFGEVTESGTLGAAFEADRAYASTVVVSCLASRTGGVSDSEAIDYQATHDVLAAGRAAGANHFVLLSAVCVQRPLLAFQRAKLRLEGELAAMAEADSAFSYTVVRPTAFFKSLAAQVDTMKKGWAYVMFGDGALAKCNALSERDLARFMALCARDEAKRNAVLPVGGPGPPVTPKEQADIAFRLLGRRPSYWKVPIGIMDAAIGLLAGVAKVFPGAEDAAEFARIGRYYATEDMLGPSFGEDTLEQFFANALKEGGMAEQDLGDARIF